MQHVFPGKWLLGDVFQCALFVSTYKCYVLYVQ